MVIKAAEEEKENDILKVMIWIFINDGCLCWHSYSPDLTTLDLFWGNFKHAYVNTRRWKKVQKIKFVNNYLRCCHIYLLRFSLLIQNQNRMRFYLRDVLICVISVSNKIETFETAIRRIWTHWIISFNELIIIICIHYTHPYT